MSVKSLGMIHFYEMMSNISLLSLAPHAALWEAAATDTALITCSDQRIAIVQRSPHEKNSPSLLNNSKISTASQNSNHAVQFNLSLLIKQAFKLFQTNGYEVLCDLGSKRKTDEMPHLHGIFSSNYRKCLYRK